MKGGGCDRPINARIYQGALPEALFEQHARPIMEAGSVIPSPIKDTGNCCFLALNKSVYDDDR